MQYYLRRQEGIALRWLLSEEREGIEVVILEGPPGTGKTFFSEYCAQELGAQYIYYQCHHWTSDEDLYQGIHIGRVVTKQGVETASDVYQEGVLTRAAIDSRQGPVVLCLDEIDKAPERSEALLLDFLQNGRTIMMDGSIVQGVRDNLVVIMTTNGVRPLMEATNRRGFRITMEFLPAKVEADAIRKKMRGGPRGPIHMVVKMGNIIREKGATSPSMQEMYSLLKKVGCCQNAEDLEVCIKGTLCKEEEDWEVLNKEMKNPQNQLWGEYQRCKKR